MLRGMRRILWVAVADARGHLMRAHLAKALLAPVGIDVEIATTTAEGVAFLDALGTPATRFGRGYSLAFDARQNMLRGATSRRLLRYLASPGHLWSDLRRLERIAPRYDLIVNDSFHPALFVAPLILERRSVRIVNVYGEQLLTAFARYHAALPIGVEFDRAVHRTCRRAFACIEHTLSCSRPERRGRTFRLRPLTAEPTRTRSDVRRSLGGRRLAAVYLNPHFSDPRVAARVERALASAGYVMHAVGEGYRNRPGWRRADPDLTSVIGAADLLLSAPGMGSLSQSLTFGIPHLLLVTDQPEQRRNLRYLEGHPHEVVGVDESEAALTAAVRRLGKAGGPPEAPGPAAVRTAWRQIFLTLLREKESSCSRSISRLPSSSRRTTSTAAAPTGSASWPGWSAFSVTSEDRPTGWTD